MADQMREARRKRILENSEKRLQRILGVNSNVEEPLASHSESVSSASKTEKHTELQSLSNNFASEEVTFPRQRLNEMNKHEIPNQTVFETVTHDYQTTESMLNTDKVNIPNIKEEQLQKNFASILVILAITSITLLYTGFGVLICHNVLIPFGLFETYLLLAIKGDKNQPNSLFNTALMLSGLPKNKLSQLTSVTLVMKTITQDLCVYLFSCLLCYQLYLIVN